MDEFSIYGGTFELYLENLSKVLRRCKKVNLVLNWKKYHSMVKIGVALGHVISHRDIEVDKGKIEVIDRLPPPLV